MYRTEYNPKFRLNYELEHFIEIGNRFDQRDIPQKYKEIFFRLLLSSINEVFPLSVCDAWNGFSESCRLSKKWIFKS